MCHCSEVFNQVRAVGGQTAAGNGPVTRLLFLPCPSPNPHPYSQRTHTHTHTHTDTHTHTHTHTHTQCLHSAQCRHSLCLCFRWFSGFSWSGLKNRTLKSPLKREVSTVRSASSCIWIRRLPS